MYCFLLFSGWMHWVWSTGGNSSPVGSNPTESLSVRRADLVGLAGGGCHGAQEAQGLPLKRLSEKKENRRKASWTKP